VREKREIARGMALALDGARGDLREGAMRRLWMNGLAAFVAMMFSACDTWGPHQSVASPSDDPSLTASIRAPLLQTLSVDDFEQTRMACSRTGRFTGPLDIVMTAGQNVDLHEVHLRLLDAAGRFLDQDDFSQEDLTSAFGTTVIPGGTVRTFRFHTNLACGRGQPQFVEADIEFTEASGRKNSISISTPFESVIVVRNGL
jgi:hypothetical protein